MKKLDSLLIVFVIAAMFLSFFLVGIASTDFPTKPITMYICYGAGGTTDLSARILATAAEKVLGQPITPVNKTGGGGTLALTLLKNKKPDGYTISIFCTAAITRTPHIMEVEYDLWNDFDFIMKYGLYTIHLATTGDKPYKTYKELIAYAKENPGKVKIATTGPVEAETLALIYLAAQEEIDWKVAPFDSTAAAMTALLGGHVDACSVSGLANYLPQVETGELVPLVTYNTVRSPKFPDTPTLIDEGYGVSIASGIGFAAPKGLPEDVAKKLEEALLEATYDPDFLKLTDRMAMPLPRLGREDFLKNLKAEYTVFKDLMEKIGVTKQ